MKKQRKTTSRARRVPLQLGESDFPSLQKPSGQLTPRVQLVSLTQESGSFSSSPERCFKLQESDFPSLEDAKSRSTARVKKLSFPPESGAPRSSSTNNSTSFPSSPRNSALLSSSLNTGLPPSLGRRNLLSTTPESRQPLSGSPQPTTPLYTSPGGSKGFSFSSTSPKTSDHSNAPSNIPSSPTTPPNVEIPQSRAYHISHWKYALRKSLRLVAFDDERYIPKHSGESPVIQEIGIAIFDPDLMPDRLKYKLLDPAWLSTAISLIKTRHVRIREALSLVNDRNVPPNFSVCPGGCQDHAIYCKTEVAKRENVNKIISRLLNEREEDSPAAFRQTALLMQGCGDVATLQDLGVDIDTDHILPLDLQQINEPRIDHYGRAHPLALRYAVEQLGISYQHAHNASNDATWTLISGLVAGIQEILLHRTGRELNIDRTYAKGHFMPLVSRAAAALSQKNHNKRLFHP